MIPLEYLKRDEAATQNRYLVKVELRQILGVYKN